MCTAMSGRSVSVGLLHYFHNIPIGIPQDVDETSAESSKDYRDFCKNCARFIPVYLEHHNGELLFQTQVAV